MVNLLGLVIRQMAFSRKEKRLIGYFGVENNQ
jgi:hypothetical protein